MRSYWRIVAAAAVLTFGLSLTAPAGESGTWQVGLARAKITPPKSMWLAGYGARDRPSEGTLHDLWIKVLALEDAQGNRGVVLTSDLLGFPRGMYDRITTQLEKRCGLTRAQVMLTASHTHSGPVLRDALYDIYPLDDHQRALIEEYSAELEKTVVATIEKALADMAPATLSAGQGTCAFAANRRNNSEADVVKLLAEGKPPKGPSERSVPVLAVKTPDGKLRAVVFGYACHCTTLSSYEWSGDYAGFAQLALEKAHPGAEAMFWAGCGADQNPLPRRSVELCRKYGEMLAAGVDDVLGKPMRPIGPRLQTTFATIELKYDPPTAADLKEAIKRGSYYARWGKRLLARLEAGETFAGTYDYPVAAWKLGGQQLWIALGGEVVVDYALKLKDTYGPDTWVAGYTNDVMAYIPSHRVRQEGGYEAGAFYVYGLPANRWSEDIETRITAAVDRLVKRLE